MPLTDSQLAATTVKQLQAETDRLARVVYEALTTAHGGLDNELSSVRAARKRVTSNALYPLGAFEFLVSQLDERLQTLEAMERIQTACDFTYL